MRRQWKTVTEVQKLCDFSLDEIERGLERKKTEAPKFGVRIPGS